MMPTNFLRQKILVVDDEEAIRLFYRYELEEAGYAVKTAANAKDAFTVLDDDAIDLVVMDIKMPGMNGIEALQKIIGKKKGVPVIINSSYSHFKESYLTWLADEFVVKSPDLNELKKKIGNTLGRSMNPGLRRGAFIEEKRSPCTNI